MLFARIDFGPCPDDREFAEIVIKDYLGMLAQNGQVEGSQWITAQQGHLVAYVNVQGAQAFAPRLQSEFTRRDLARVVDIMGQAPTHEIIDDDATKRDVTFAGAPFLYLRTHCTFVVPPIRRGDNHKPVPTYRVPGPHKVREDVMRWKWIYDDHDAVWIDSGTLEYSAYREMADPGSYLSERGRESCAIIEKATGIPTYYHLFRWGARRKDESKRRCPGCGGKWRVPGASDDDDDRIGYLCKRCRLVSNHTLDREGARVAAIGEWKGKRIPRPKAPRSE